jgi:reactive chlorine resistance protein C
MKHTIEGSNIVAGGRDHIGWLTLARVNRIERAALGVLRYGLVFFLLMFGAMKFAASEAEGIRPLIEHSPLMSWMYSLFSVRTASAILGVFEIAVGVLIAAWRFAPRVSGFASLAACLMFVVTLSFLGTTPGVLEPTSETGGFLMKDLMLLGAALLTGAQALRAALSPKTPELAQ